MKRVFIFLFIPFFFICQSYGQENRGLNVLVKQLDPGYRAGKQFLFIIAIDNYKFWPPLKNPVKDAKEIRDILASRYYIDEVTELYNESATKANIIKEFENYQKKLAVNDSLLIYYAGHGHLDTITNTGFWIPINAGLDKYEQSNWLPNTQIRGIVSGIKSIHFLIISDSCFSGDLLNSSRAMPDEINNEYFKKAYARNSRQILTSGASESVPDESEFSRMLKIALTKNSSPYCDPFMLFNEIRLGVRGTMPMFGNLKDTGHQEGASFLLFLKEEQPKEVLEKEEANKEEPIQDEGKVESEDAGKSFSDHFNSADLSSKWRWVRENPSKWSLKERPGFLTILTERGDTQGSHENKNMPLTDVVSSDFQVETKLEFDPTHNWQQAGLVVYKNDDAYIRITYLYASDVGGNNIEMGKGMHGDFVKENFAFSSSTVYLRIIKSGNKYSGFASNDGQSFRLVKEFTYNLGEKPKVGLVAFNGDIDAGKLPAYFDYFKILYQEEKSK